MAELDPEDFPEESLGYEFKRNLALIIGIDAYQNGYPKLKTAVNDAQAVADLLVRKPHNYEVTTLLDAQATTTGLKNVLDKNKSGSWASRIGAQDRVLVYFAGHGLAEHSEKGPVGLMLLHDADLSEKGRGRLEMAQLQKWLNDLPCRHMLVVLDCCFAGAMAWSGQGVRSLPPEVIHKERYDHYVEYPAWQLITSAGDDERALDEIPSEEIPEVLRYVRRQTDDNHSPFAKALIEGLRDGAGDIYPPGQPGQPPGDGLITASELILHLANQVSDIAEGANHKQVPKLWPLPKHSSGEFVFLNPNREMQLNPAPDLDINNNPYRPDALTEADAELFYGRESELRELLEKVIEEPLTLVTGASGVGKSSLVRAGLLPRFTGYKPPKRPGESENDEASVDPDQWRALPTFIPDKNPTEALLDLLQTQLSDDASVVPPSDLPLLLAGWAKANPQRKLLLVIDQLERVLPQPSMPEPITLPEVEAFFAQLQSLINFELCHLVLVIREDRKAELEKLLEARNVHPFEVAPLDSESDLQKALERPAWARVLYYDPPELVINVVKQLNRGPGALSLLAQFGSQVYLNFIARKSQSRAITETVFRKVGDVTSFICKAADAIYNGLSRKEDNDEQATMRRVVLRLMDIEGGELNRRRIPHSELDYGDNTENERVTEIIRQLTEARLLVWSDVEGQPHLELAHDALVQDWELAKSWRRAEKDEKILLQRRVTKDAREWIAAENGRETSLSLRSRLRHLWERMIADPGEGSVKHLWHDSPYLPQTEQLLEGENRQRGLWRYFFGHVLQPAHRFWLNALELEFVQRSVNRQRRERCVVLEILTIVVILLAFAALFSRQQQLYAEEQEEIAIAARIEAEEQRDEAERQARISQARELASQSANLLESDPVLSLLLAVEGVKITYKIDKIVTSEAEAALYQALSHPLQTTIRGRFAFNDTAVFSPDGSLIATPSDDGSVQLWTLAGDLIATLQGNNEDRWIKYADSAPAFNRSGSRIFYGASLWDIEGNLISTLNSHLAPVSSGKFNVDGTKIVVAYSDGIVELWDIDGNFITALVSEMRRAISATFSPDGGLILTKGCTIENDFGGCGKYFVQLWDINGILVASRHDVTDADFSPDGAHVFTVSEDGIVRLWDMEGAPTSLKSGLDWITAANFSPDSTRIVVTGCNWDSPNVCSEIVRQLWSVNGERIALLEGNSSWTSFSPDSTRIVTADGNGTVRLWDKNGNLITESSGHTTHLTPASFSRDSTQLITADMNGTIRLWDKDGNIRSSLRDTINITSVSFSRDGSHFFTLGCDPLEQAEGCESVARIWNVSPELVTSFRGNENRVYSIKFDPEGTQLLTAGCDDVGQDGYTCIEGTAQLRDVNGKLATILEGHTSWIAGDFSPNGKQIMTAGGDGTAQLWDTTGNVLAVLKDQMEYISSADFSPDGTLIVKGGCDKINDHQCAFGFARLWDTNGNLGAVQNREQTA